MKDQMEVCPLSREAMLLAAPSLSPSSCTCTPMDVPYGSLSLSGGIQAYHVSLDDTDGLGALCSPVAFSAHERGQVNPLYPLRCLLA